jgi:hypothetical protein
MKWFRFTLFGAYLLWCVIEKHSSWIPLFVLALTFWGQFAAGLRWLGQLPGLIQEHWANSVLECSFAIERVLQHPALDRLFTRLQEEGKAPAATIQEWRAFILQRNAHLYPDSPARHSVRFNVKAGMLFKNDRPDYADYYFLQYIHIPYADEDRDHSRSWFRDSCEHVLSFRVLVVNGFFRLEVGEFSQKYSPRVIKPGFLGVYETWEAIAVFLMYFGLAHRIPARYMNANADATPSRKHDRSWDDWKAFNVELNHYRKMCQKEMPDKDFTALLKLCEEKAEPILEREGYEKGDGKRSYIDGGTHSNRYWTVFFNDLTNNKYQKRKWFIDYREDTT